MKKKIMPTVRCELTTSWLLVGSARHSPTLFVGHYFQSNVYKGTPHFSKSIFSNLAEFLLLWKIKVRVKTFAYTKYKQFLRWTVLKVPLLVPRFDLICPTVRRARLHGNISLARGTSKVDSDLCLELMKWLPSPTYILYFSSLSRM